jgi:translation elongation factor EF-1beta
MKINKAEFYKTIENKHLPNEHQSILILREVEAEELPLNVIKVKGRVSNYIGTQEEALHKLKNTYNLKLSIDEATIQNVKVDKVETDALGFGMVYIELSVVPSWYKSEGINMSNSDIRGITATEGYVGKITDKKIYDGGIIPNSSLVEIKENEIVVNLKELESMAGARKKDILDTITDHIADKLQQEKGRGWI